MVLLNKMHIQSNLIKWMKIFSSGMMQILDGAFYQILWITMKYPWMWLTVPTDTNHLSEYLIIVWKYSINLSSYKSKCESETQKLYSQEINLLISLLWICLLMGILGERIKIEIYGGHIKSRWHKYLNCFVDEHV